LRQWQARTNLIANNTITDIWQRHMMDSVQLFPLAMTLMPTAKHWLDVGSGGGFPALVLAIIFKARGEGHVTLIESNSKKVSFLRRVIATLRLPAHIINQRIEISSGQMSSLSDIITARALADLPKLLTLISPFFNGHTIALLQKGRNFLQEVEQARRDWRFDIAQYPSVTESSAVILTIRNLRPI